jgi:hypothetical protein
MHTCVSQDQKREYINCDIQDGFFLCYYGGIEPLHAHVSSNADIFSAVVLITWPSTVAGIKMKGSQAATLVQNDMSLLETPTAIAFRCICIASVMLEMPRKKIYAFLRKHKNNEGGTLS